MADESKRCSTWRVLAQDPGKHKVDIRVDGTEFDELVVGEWLHLERMDTHDWWMGVDLPNGNRVHFNFRVSKDGKAEVTITEGKELVRQ